MKTNKPQTPADFFFEHAGWSYDPEKETEAQGKRRGANRLAKAEKHAREAGYSFEWSLDGGTNREWTDEGPKYGTWQCLAHNQAGNVIASLCGIDFGKGGEPWGNDYRRVVEAELALETMP